MDGRGTPVPSVDTGMFSIANLKSLHTGHNYTMQLKIKFLAVVIMEGTLEPCHLHLVLINQHV